jgi:hypothetical protein
MMGDLVDDGRGDPVRDTAAVAEQHPSRGAGRSAKRPATLAGST